MGGRVKRIGENVTHNVFYPGVIIVSTRHGTSYLPAGTWEEFHTSVFWILNHKWFQEFAKSPIPPEPSQPSVRPKNVPEGVARKAVSMEWAGYKNEHNEWIDVIEAKRDLAKILESRDCDEAWAWIVSFEFLIPGIESIRFETFERYSARIGVWE